MNNEVFVGFFNYTFDIDYQLIMGKFFLLPSSRCMSGYCFPYVRVHDDALEFCVVRLFLFSVHVYMT